MLLKTCRKGLYTCIVKHFKSVNNSRTITTCIYQFGISINILKCWKKIFHFTLKLKKKKIHYNIIQTHVMQS